MKAEIVRPAGVDEPSTALAPRPDAPVAVRGSSWALARMSDEEFDATMLLARKGRERLQKVMRSMMTEGVHFGKIPGTDKDVLLKPGSEVLFKMFHLVPDTQASVSYGDGVVSPHISVRSKCIVHMDDLDGPVVAVGEAAGNSWEKKWRYRQAERTCPSCKKVGAIIKGKEQYGGGWLCFAKRGGCGAKWPDGAEAIESQQLGQVENPDPYDLENTIVKIVNKRARMDAIITATASSDLLTQDLEEDVPSGSPPQQAGQAKRSPIKASPLEKQPVPATDADILF